jgi:hypothetical protein
MTSLTRYSSLFCNFLTGADLRRHAIRGDSIDGAAPFNIVIIASLAGILFSFDKAVIAGVATALREFFCSRRPISERRFHCAVGHIARSNIVDGPGDRDGSRNMPRVVGLV